MRIDRLPVYRNKSSIQRLEIKSITGKTRVLAFKTKNEATNRDSTSVSTSGLEDPDKGRPSIRIIKRPKDDYGVV